VRETGHRIVAFDPDVRPLVVRTHRSIVPHPGPTPAVVDRIKGDVHIREALVTRFFMEVRVSRVCRVVAFSNCTGQQSAGGRKLHG
jgi:hypothetical protein